MSALDELARHLGDPDRPFDARALELVAQARAERAAGVTPLGHLRDDLDMPFTATEPGTYLDVSKAVISSALTVAAAAIPLPPGDHAPALVLNFARYDGHLLRPVLLAMDHSPLHRLPQLVEQAVHAACQAARR